MGRERESLKIIVNGSYRLHRIQIAIQLKKANLLFYPTLYCNRHTSKKIYCLEKSPRY